ncbi:MAG TPA: serine/threonine-protein kinase, partial [Thermoanaerobaculia bacterium]
MTLAAGSRLGPYEILAPVGAGGMGEVYKARDTRLERTVAVKVLPTHLSDSESLRQRFEREAKTISQLSHPHICAVYDVGREGGIEYLVMEYLEGETLADRLGKSALPLDQTLRFGFEIAQALDGAHRQGIVHRDLKPGNVMLTRSGVKLLDFGLAFQRPRGAAGRERTAAHHYPMAEQETALPTEIAPLTEAGTILGTFQYMAPEQLEGREADARTDIFALGCVLYEMASGRKAFSGTS